MASATLHIKDAYYFEVPKFFWRSRRDSRDDFPEFWVKLDPDYQRWEAEQLYPALEEVFGNAKDANGQVVLPAKHDLIETYEHWKHEDHRNFGKPFERFLMEHEPWFRNKIEVQSKNDDGSTRAAERLAADREQAKAWQEKWETAREGKVDFSKYDHDWSAKKVEGYNKALHGKILIPQPFGKLNNLYEPASGFCISKFMLVQILVAILIVVAFNWLAKKIVSGDRPQGRLWNLMESVLLFLRDEVARPAIGKHDADKFVPLLWTVFLFILFCNLFGMVPWMGAPTGAFAVTFALACVTFLTGLIFGSIKFGVAGYWANQVPAMDLPFVLAIVIKPAIFLIEVLGLFIKHGVLSVRLLANMVAGHLVLLGIMGMAFSLEGAMSPSWPITAVVSVVASTLFSCLELFVAFLQAYIFTFLSALFIGAAVHHH